MSESTPAPSPVEQAAHVARHAYADADAAGLGHDEALTRSLDAFLGVLRDLRVVQDRPPAPSPEDAAEWLLGLCPDYVQGRYVGEHRRRLLTEEGSVEYVTHQARRRYPGQSDMAASINAARDLLLASIRDGTATGPLR